MAKEKLIWVCSSCGIEQPRWSGQCPSCKEWNTLLSKEDNKNSALKTTFMKPKAYAKKLKEIKADTSVRIDTGIKELNHVLGSGIVVGSVVLVGGDPGIGKSTLLLQMCENIKDKNILYVTGEESDVQIKLRADRLGVKNENLSVYAENNLNNIEDYIKNENPELIIVDSIQTVYRPDVTSAPGSVSQVREVTSSLTNIAKSTNTTIFIIGHVTKDGNIAGPKVLEHLVDTVLYFEGDRFESYRILRAVKNRYGSTNEIGVFEMRGDGFAEVLNPSSLFINPDEDDNGCSISCILEGTRPVLVELQALVSKSNFGNPRRMAAGFDNNRLILLIAVLEKKCKLKLFDQDSYVNVVGGLKISDRATDLSLCMAIASSYANISLPKSTAFIGEVSLTGEIRPVSSIEKRISECKKLGFKNIVIPPSTISEQKDINIIQEKYLSNLIEKYIKKL